VATYRLSHTGDGLTSVFSQVATTEDDQLTVAVFDVDVAGDDDTQPASVVNNSLLCRSSSTCWRFNSSRYRWTWSNGIWSQLYLQCKVYKWQESKL